jgi:Cobalamin synthesis protein cobW C-terminal domain
LLDRVEARLRSVNAVAQIVRSARAQVSLDRILGLGAFDLGKVLEMDPTFLEQTERLHDTSVTSVGIELEGDLDPERLNAWIFRLLREKGVDIFRSKGILAVPGNANRSCSRACTCSSTLRGRAPGVMRGVTAGWSSSAATSPAAASRRSASPPAWAAAPACSTRSRSSASTRTFPPSGAPPRSRLSAALFRN